MERIIGGETPVGPLVVCYALGLALALVVASALVAVAVPLSGGRSPVIVAPLVAAVVEPVGSKLLPALALATWGKRRGWSPVGRPLRAGVLGGLVVGGGEVAVKLLTTAGLYGGVTAVTGGVLLPLVLHATTGGLIGNAALRPPAERRRRWQHPSAATATAVLLHLAWNGLIVADMLSRV